MSVVKNFRISTSLRKKGFDLLTRYEPSDLAYTLGGSLYDRSKKMEALMGQNPHGKDHYRELKQKKDSYFKAAKRFLALSKTLKMLEM